MVPEIRYDILNQAINHYINFGYTKIEVPWMVPERIHKATFPGDISSLTTKYGVLVGSAEQGFLQLVEEGKLEKDKKYCAVSPCFRTDDLDETHFRWFLKLELFAWSDLMTISDGVVYDAVVFIKNYFATNLSLNSFQQNVKIVRTHEGKDIEINGVEVGSFGKRTGIGLNWICGTGLALPRFNIAVDTITV